jgi:hypothetical protein
MNSHASKAAHDVDERGYIPKNDFGSGLSSHGDDDKAK